MTLEIEEERLMEIVAAALEPVKRAVEKLDEARLAAEARADRLERERDGAIRGREANAAAYMEAEGRAVEAEQERDEHAAEIDQLTTELSDAAGHVSELLQELPTPAEAVALQHAMNIASPQWRIKYDTPELRSKLRARAAVSGSGKEKP